VKRCCLQLDLQPHQVKLSIKSYKLTLAEYIHELTETIMLKTHPLDLREDTHTRKEEITLETYPVF